MSAPFSPNIMIAMNIVTLPPGTIRTRSGDTSTLEPAVQILRHRLAQRRNPGRVGIAVLAVAQRLDGGLDDMGRRFEIGLADAEIDDVAPLALQLGRPRQHGEGVLLADALKGGLDGDGHWACLRGVGAPFGKAGPAEQGLVSFTSTGTGSLSRKLDPSAPAVPSRPFL